MDNEEYIKFVDQIRTDVLDKIDFKSGIVQVISKDTLEMA